MPDPERGASALSVRLPVVEHDRSPARLRSPMADHHLSARVWMSAALLSVFLPAQWQMGWWLTLHLLLVGAASQLIVGGHIMFSTTLGVSRGPDRSLLFEQLMLLNVGAAGIIGGRVFDAPVLLALGATAFVAAVISCALVTEDLWRSAINRRFEPVRTFYRLASVSLLLGAGIGGAMAVGALGDAAAYDEHKLAHLVLNLWGWAGLTILGTMLTLLPTVLHVRAPRLELNRIPWILFGALLIMVTGLTMGAKAILVTGSILFVVGLRPVGRYLHAVVRTPRRRRLPGAALGLMCAVVWFATIALAQVGVAAFGSGGALRNLWVVGLGFGCVAQAVLGAWAFLLPASRPAPPDERRRELFAFESGARVQTAAYNLGLVLVLGELQGLVPESAGAVGVALVWLASAWMVTKAWAFRAMAASPKVAERAERFWVPTDGRGVTGNQVNT